MSNSIWKTPDEIPACCFLCVFDRPMGRSVGHYNPVKKQFCSGELRFEHKEINKFCMLDDLIAQADKAERLQKQLDSGECSDGYHTFNELYYHRMCLFSIIVKQNKNLAWKSKLHSDGTMFDNYFIVGIDTPNGQATYHYHIEHWDMFDCVELSNAPEWDGHTAEDTIKRLLSLTKSNN